MSVFPSKVKSSGKHPVTRPQLLRQLVRHSCNEAGLPLNVSIFSPVDSVFIVLRTLASLRHL
jgi:hypothetical protein